MHTQNLHASHVANKKKDHTRNHDPVQGLVDLFSHRNLSHHHWLTRLRSARKIIEASADPTVEWMIRADMAEAATLSLPSSSSLDV